MRMKPINVPGSYLTEPIIPLGFMQTTAEVGEIVDFELMPQAPAGMHGNSTWSMIGIAPELTLSVPASLDKIEARFGRRAAEPLLTDAAMPDRLSVMYYASGEISMQVSTGW